MFPVSDVLQSVKYNKEVLDSLAASGKWLKNDI
jgi:hypothetical protein